MPAPAPARGPQDVPALLRALLADDPGRPRLTWYGPDPERVELSGRVLDNWVAKTANLLVEELDAGPGSTVAVDLPPSWRTAVWLLATWSAGACAAVVDGGRPVAAADVVVTATPQAHAGIPGRLVAVALPALAVRFDGPLPPGALDAAAEVRSYGDVFLPPVLPAPGDPAFAVRGATLSHADLLPAARAAADEQELPDGVRLLTGAGPDLAVPALLAPLVRGGSVVLHHDLDALDDGALRSLAAQEGVGSIAGARR